MSPCNLPPCYVIAQQRPHSVRVRRMHADRVYQDKVYRSEEEAKGYRQRLNPSLLVTSVLPFSLTALLVASLFSVSLSLQP